MSTTPNEPRFLDAAESHLARAVAGDHAEVAVVALALIGRGALSNAPGADLDLPAALAAALREHPRLIARAAAALGMYCEMDGETALPEMLYARSGYQVLLDARIWPEPPLDRFHLEESDEELLDLSARVALPPDELPRQIPDTHIWWQQQGRR